MILIVDHCDWNIFVLDRFEFWSACACAWPNKHKLHQIYLAQPWSIHQLCMASLNKILVLGRFSLPHTQQVSVLFWAVAAVGCGVGVTVDCTECMCCNRLDSFPVEYYLTRLSGMTDLLPQKSVCFSVTLCKFYRRIAPDRLFWGDCSALSALNQ